MKKDDLCKCGHIWDNHCQTPYNKCKHCQSPMGGGACGLCNECREGFILSNKFEIEIERICNIK